MAKQARQSSDGYCERWLRQCGERPLRAFWMLWSILFCLSLIPLVIRFQHERNAIGPPRVDGIPYRDFIAGGSQVWNQGDELPLRADELPEFKARQPFVYIALTRESRSSKTWLQADVCEKQGRCGWPWTSLCWASTSYWNVSNPHEPFRAAADPLARSFFWHPQQFAANWYTRRGTRAYTISFLLPGILMQLAFPQIFSASLVVPLGLVYHQRRRSRLRRRCCLNCGHQQDPHKSVGVCPECGSMESSNDLKNRRLASHWILGGVCALLVCAWSIAQIASRTDGLEHRVADQMQRLSDVTTSSNALVHLRVDGYGWPIDTVFIQTDHWFSVAPGQAPKPMPASGQSGLSGDQSYVYYNYTHRNPSVTTLITVMWSQIVLQIGLLIALIISIVTLYRACELTFNKLQRRKNGHHAAAQS
jgi:hypothetical protein